MGIDIIEDRLKEYSFQSKQEEINALKEIYQEIALCALARSDFFKVGAFQGGTCLRILYKLRRFSEDLDFLLISPQSVFEWQPFLAAMELEFSSFGLTVQVKDRSKAEGVIKKAFLKQDSFGRILQLKHPLLPSDKQTIEIKLEIDTNPPAGSLFETQYLDYPFPFSITIQDRASLFASKCHALLCRDFLKGRDWFDFLWYVSKQFPINYLHLKKALIQAGPFRSQELSIDRKWLVEHLRKKIETIDWKTARLDVENFLAADERKIVAFWSKDLFLSALAKFNAYLEEADAAVIENLSKL
jgi:hypothetical protein